jgi:hypothetical protein
MQSVVAAILGTSPDAVAAVLDFIPNFPRWDWSLLAHFHLLSMFKSRSSCVQAKC